MVHLVPWVDKHDIAILPNHRSRCALEKPLDGHILIVARHQEAEVLLDPGVSRADFGMMPGAAQIGAACDPLLGDAPLAQLAPEILLGKIFEARPRDTQRMGIGKAAYRV